MEFFHKLAQVLVFHSLLFFCLLCSERPSMTKMLEGDSSCSEQCSAALSLCGSRIRYIYWERVTDFRN